MTLSLDFETCCEANLKAVGADIYARDPSLVVTVLAWAWDDKPVQSIKLPKHLPFAIVEHLDGGGIFHAWNAAFEQAILERHYGLRLDPGQASCTMQRALHAGLPAALSEAGPALGVAIVKDDAARRLMLSMSKPRAILAGGARRYWHADAPDRLDRLESYCKRDVESERAIACHIPRLPPSEQQVSILDRRANNLGVRVDLDLAARLRALSRTEIRALDAECAALTEGQVHKPGTEIARLMAWLASAGCPLAGLSREEVAAALAQVRDPTVKRVLEIRQEVAKSSLKKLDAMTRCAGPDERVRGQLAYYGASRTGRFAGRLVQLHNLPRPVKDAGLALKPIMRGASAPFLRALFASKPLDIVASLLRACLIPAPGKCFIVYDLAQIEARVVAWLAGQQDILAVFRDATQDVYAWTAKRQGSGDRQFGKVLTLACGFGMGAARFLDTASGYGVTLTFKQAENAIADWRTANSRIVRLWRAADNAVRAALSGPPASVRVNDKVEVLTTRTGGSRLMTLKLPSGRRLYYRNARLKADGRGHSIHYDGVDQRTRQWGTQRTYGGKLVENITQAVARDVIVEAALRVDRRNLGDLVLSVHDELVFETTPERDPEIRACFEQRPAWGLDLPVACSGGVKWRYGK